MTEMDKGPESIAHLVLRQQWLNKNLGISRWPSYDNSAEFAANVAMAHARTDAEIKAMNPGALEAVAADAVEHAILLAESDSSPVGAVLGDN